MTRLVYLVLWCALLAEALFVAPEPRPDQSAWLADLLLFRWGREEPLVVGEFQLMGAWSWALAAILAPRMRASPVPLWPFALASLPFGAFALLPGLVLVGTNRMPLEGWPRLLRHRALLLLLALFTLSFAVWMAAQGDGLWWWRTFRREQFVHLMTFDFVTLWVTSVLAAREEGGPWWWCLFPIFGALAWAWRRPAGGTGAAAAFQPAR